MRTTLIAGLAIVLSVFYSELPLFAEGVGPMEQPHSEVMPAMTPEQNQKTEVMEDQILMGMRAQSAAMDQVLGVRSPAHKLHRSVVDILQEDGTRIHRETTTTYRQDEKTPRVIQIQERITDLFGLVVDRTTVVKCDVEGNPENGSIRERVVYPDGSTQENRASFVYSQDRSQISRELLTRGNRYGVHIQNPDGSVVHREGTIISYYPDGNARVGYEVERFTDFTGHTVYKATKKIYGPIRQLPAKKALPKKSSTKLNLWGRRGPAKLGSLLNATRGGSREYRAGGATRTDRRADPAAVKDHRVREGHPVLRR